MLSLKAEIDTKEWDFLFKKVDAFLVGSGVHQLAAQAVAGRVRDTYDFRWDEAYGRKFNRGFYSKKKEDLGLRSGTLTGASFRAITSEADNDEGRVLLKGVWPGFDLGSPYLPFEPEEFKSKTYGEDMLDFPEKGEIMWLHPIAGDDIIAASAVEQFIDFLVDPKKGFSPGIIALLTNDPSGEIPSSFLGEPEPKFLEN